jgi:hypothetical protein
VAIGTDSGVVALTSNEDCGVLVPSGVVTNDEASTFGTHFDGGMPVPPLLAAFADWLAAEGLDGWPPRSTGCARRGRPRLWSTCPIHARWLNRIEIVFSVLQRKVIKPVEVDR